ncbi:hypothetical protein SAMN04489726_0968 [Allokutzneria albata]|uniref:Uncharacterized protein n=1 Tax=Allokutzneria albata TaxID=211114 RepID=A0A1G9S8U3_ALLAB|nr:hypothetical protein SAMN04489726_0968 [Allokutzneria albata]
MDLGAHEPAQRRFRAGSAGQLSEERVHPGRKRITSTVPGPSPVDDRAASAQASQRSVARSAADVAGVVDRRAGTGRAEGSTAGVAADEDFVFAARAARIRRGERSAVAAAAYRSERPERVRGTVVVAQAAPVTWFRPTASAEVWLAGAGTDDDLGDAAARAAGPLRRDVAAPAHRAVRSPGFHGPDVPAPDTGLMGSRCARPAQRITVGQAGIGPASRGTRRCVRAQRTVRTLCLLYRARAALRLASGSPRTAAVPPGAGAGQGVGQPYQHHRHNRSGSRSASGRVLRCSSRTRPSCGDHASAVRRIACHVSSSIAESTSERRNPTRRSRTSAMVSG